MRLIYCHGGNSFAMSVARSLGWEAGSRSDKVIYGVARPLSLLDIEWRGYDWKRHVSVAPNENPWLGAVPDVETEEQLPHALNHAEELAPYCDHLLFIPKAFGIIEQIPGELGGKPVILGYSVPTAYGGTDVPLWEFGQRPVHLLGGSPRKQAAIARYLNVVSLDGNMAWKLAGRGVFYSKRGVSGPSMMAQDGQRWHDDQQMPYEALRRSLSNLRIFWGDRLG